MTQDPSMKSRASHILLAMFAACGGTGGPAAPDGSTLDAPITRPLAVASVEDLGAIPLPSPVTVGRDGGQAGALDGKLLWTFGDTFLSAQNPIDGSNVLSATAGWSTTAAPLALTQPVDANGFPAQLIPYTDDERAQNQADPLNGWALWPGILIATGEGDGVVVFQRIKRTSGSGFDSQGTGTARITVDATIATRGSQDLFSPPDRLFVPHFVVDENVYAWACETVGFLDIGCRMARAPVASADVRAAYSFFDGSQWQPDASTATIVIDHVSGGPTISWNPYLGRYLAVTSAVLSSDLLLRTADRIEGPWSEPVVIEAGTEGYLAPTTTDAYDYIVVEHPELASPDGRSIVISYSRPTAPFRGDVRLARITFE